MENRMIDPTVNEKKAMEISSERAGEYIEWLKKTDMETFTREEWKQFVEVIVSGYIEGMANLADDEVPF
jgi:uncharacterized protein YdaT